MHPSQEIVPAFPDFHLYRAQVALRVLQAAQSDGPLTEAPTLCEKQAIRDAVRVLRG